MEEILLLLIAKEITIHLVSDNVSGKLISISNGVATMITYGKIDEHHWGYDETNDVNNRFIMRTDYVNRDKITKVVQYHEFRQHDKD